MGLHLAFAFLLLGACIQGALGSSASDAGTLAPTMVTGDDLKLYSYFCLKQEQTLCLGISTDIDPYYNADALYQLQVKRRDNNEAKKLDYRKMRWTVDRYNGRIQLSNFTSLCVSRTTNLTTIPMGAVLRPCGTTGALEVFNLTNFLDANNVNEEGLLSLRNYQGQCLSMLTCNLISGTSFCDPNYNNIYSAGTINPDTQKGAYVKFMPCLTPKDSGYKSQIWQQTIDCAPGCSPFMMTGNTSNVCDPECNNPQCNWDNWACTTSAPTPPTPKPTRSPTVTPSHSPTTSKPTKSPTTSLPTVTPTSSPTTSLPTKTPTRSPTRSPTTSKPTVTPTFSPTGLPTHYPSMSPSKVPTTSIPTVAPTSSPTRSPTTSRPTVTPTASPTNSPSAVPTMAPTNSPTSSPSTAPSQAPTNSPTATLVTLGAAAPIQTTNWLWLWILIAALCFCCCCGVSCCLYRREQRRRQKENERAQKEHDLEAGNAPSTKNVPLTTDGSSKMNKPPPPRPRIVEPEIDIHAIVDAAKPSDENHLVQVPINEPQHPRGAVGLLWGGSNDDSTQAPSPDRRDLKRRSERFTREQLVDVLNQRSYTMPLEKVHEGDAFAEEGEYDDNEFVAHHIQHDEQPSAVSYNSQQDRSMALADSAIGVEESFAMPVEQSSAVQSVNIDGMSIRELKSFIVENGGDLTGCVEKDQFVSRAREFA